MVAILSQPQCVKYVQWNSVFIREDNCKLIILHVHYVCMDIIAMNGDI